jgi:O-methyltransferase domain
VFLERSPRRLQGASILREHRQGAVSSLRLISGGVELRFTDCSAIFLRLRPGDGCQRASGLHSSDFFKDPIPSAEVLIMGHILHDWDLSEKMR